MEKCDIPHKPTAKWQFVLIILLAFFAYTATYVGKYSYAANLNYIIDFFQINKGEAGLVETCLFIAYGVGQIVNGILCRFYNVKWSVFGGLALIALLNLIIPSVPFPYYALLWTFMGIGASFLWTSLVRLLSDNLPTNYLDGAIAVMSAPMALGTVIIYGIGAAFSSQGLDHYLFYFAGGFVALIALLWLILLPLTKANTRHSIIEETAGDTAPKKKSPWGRYALFFVAVGLISVCVNFVKDGAQTWIPVVLTDSYGYSKSVSNLFTILLPLAGVLGGLLAVLLNKKFKNFIGICLLFLLLGAVALGLIYFFYLRSAAVLISCMAFLSCFMYAANNVVTNMVPLYLRDAFPSGLLAGLIDGLCYGGSALSSYGLGLIGDNGGWGSVFLTLWISLLAVSAVTLFYLVAKRFATKKPTQDTPSTPNDSSAK